MSELQLRLFKIVPRRSGALPLGVELYFRAQDLDPGDDPVLPEIDRLGMERLRRLHLRPCGVGAGRSGERLQVRVRGDEHDEIAGALVRKLSGGDVVRLRPGVVEGVQVQHRLGEVDARIEQVEGAHE